MKKLFTTAAQASLSRLGLRVMRQGTYEALTAKASDYHGIQLHVLDEILAALCPAARSHAQLRQDIAALLVLGFKRDGYFVEFGAAGGIELSNTAMLERDFGWTGILSEPARMWHDTLHANRDCIIDTRCVWSASGARLEFTEVPLGELSTLSQFRTCDSHAHQRAQGETYLVETVSLNDLLDAHDAPEVIDYLSVDTEGSELDILRAFDFGRRTFRFISCEHNFTPARQEIHDLLASHGYRRILPDISNVDDWYVMDGV